MPIKKQIFDCFPEALFFVTTAAASTQLLVQADGDDTWVSLVVCAAPNINATRKHSGGLICQMEKNPLKWLFPNKLPYLFQKLTGNTANPLSAV